MPPDVSIIVPDLGAPSVGAAVRLRDLLSAYEVEIVGPDFGPGICSMYENARPFVSVPGRRMYRYPHYFWQVKALEQAVKGRLVIALKAFMNTVPVALRLGARGHKTAVFLDEWDGAVLQGRSGIAAWLKNAKYSMHEVHYPRVERMIPKLDLTLSTTTFLQQRFGGEVIHMGVDGSLFSSQPKKRVEALKVELGLSGKKLIVFGGVVRPHKGAELILDAIRLLNRDDVRFLVVGPITDHLEAMQANSRYGDLIHVAGVRLNDPEGVNRRIHKEMPLYLDLADLIVLPLQDNPLAQSQMPIKLFEAMAMAKPVIASAVSDLPLILKGCGKIIPPGDAAKLAEAMGQVLSDPELAADMGRQTREVFMKQYSREAAGRRLRSIVEPLL